MSTTLPDDEMWMARAVAVAETARLRSAPNPWVGCVIVAADGRTVEGATEPPGARHAEIVALDAAREEGVPTAGATMYTTLEPCSHHGRTGPCTEAIVAAGVSRVVTAIDDPDPQVAGRGHARLRAAGIDVHTGVLAEAADEQLRPYLHHRRTGRPFVVLKMAATLDGKVAARDGTSRWITGPDARARVHELRAASHAVCTGAGTVRADDPALTVRHVEGPDPRRVVVGRAPAGAAVHPCLEWDGPLDALLDRLGSEGVLQLLVEAGPRLAGSFHREGLVDRYVFHLAPALAGGDCPGVFAGSGMATITELWRGRVADVRRLGADVEVVVDR